jgi:hypothetical protein
MPNVIGENAAVLVRRNSSNFERRHVIIFVLGLPLPRENAARPSTIASRARGSAAVRLSDRAQPCAPAHAAGVGGDHINRVLAGKDARSDSACGTAIKRTEDATRCCLAQTAVKQFTHRSPGGGLNLLTAEHIIRANSFSVASVKAVSRAKASRAASRAILRQNGGRRRVLHSEASLASRAPSWNTSTRAIPIPRSFISTEFVGEILEKVACREKSAGVSILAGRWSA